MILSYAYLHFWHLPIFLMSSRQQIISSFFSKRPLPRKMLREYGNAFVCVRLDSDIK